MARNSKTGGKTDSAKGSMNSRNPKASGSFAARMLTESEVALLRARGKVREDRVAAHLARKKVAVK